MGPFIRARTFIRINMVIIYVKSRNSPLENDGNDDNILSLSELLAKVCARSTG